MEAKLRGCEKVMREAVDMTGNVVVYVLRIVAIQFITAAR